MLPDFLIIGAHKAGTTSLHHYFDQHPQVFMTAVKEPNYFSFDATNPRHLGEASNEFRAKSLAEYENLFSDAPVDAKRGEASPSYLFSSLAPARIKQALPNCKLIASLRNPVDRTYSAYQMAVRSNRTNVKVADLDPMRDPWFRNGLYSSPLRTYMDVFGADSLRIVLFEDLSTNATGVMQELFAFVGVSPGFTVDTTYRFNPGGLPARKSVHLLLKSLKRIPGLQRYAPAPLRHAFRVMRDRNLRRADPLSADIRAQWLDYFRDDILRTQDIIARDLGGWLVG